MRHEPTGGRPSTIVRAAAAATLALSLAAVVTACGAAEVVSRPTPPPVRIGALYNLTGSQAALDAPSLDGARLAVERINANGGLLGRRVELLERDGQTHTDDVRRAAQNLVAAGVSAIIGLSDTEQVLAAAPTAAAAGIPFVTSGATSPRLPEQVPDWLFLACFGDNTQAAAGAEYAYRRLGARTAVIIYDRDMEYTRLLARYFSQAFRSLGGRVRGSRGFDGDDPDVAALLGAPGRSGAPGDPASPDLVYLAAGPDDAGPVVRRLRAAGYRQPVMGGDSFDSVALAKAARATGGGVYYTTHAAPGLPSANAAVRRFDASYSAAYGRPPQNAFACLGYDAVDLVASAIDSAGSVRPAAVRDALQATRRFVGVSGTLGYAGDERVPQKRVTLVLVDRRPEVVAQFTPRFVPEP